MPFPSRAVCLASCVLLLVVPTFPAAPLRDVCAEDEPTMEINIGPQDVAMEDFLRIVSRAANVPLIWNPSDKNIRGKKVIGSVNLRAPRSQLFGLVRSLLTFYELVMIPVGPPGYQVQLVMDARQTSSILKLKPEHVVLTDENLERYAAMDGKFISAVIRVEHMVDLRNARNALTRILTGQNIGGVTEVPDARAFIVTDFAPRVVMAYRMIRSMDVPKQPQEEARFEVFTLEHAGASGLAKVASELLGVQGPRLIADPRTNQLLAYGSAGRIAQARDVIARLDVSAHGSTGPQPLYVRLKHVDAEAAAAALTQMTARVPGLWSEAASADPAPAFVAFEPGNGLMIAGTSAQCSAIVAFIGEFDVADKDE